MNSIINVQAYKHDGTLYRQWNGVKVVEVSQYSIALLMYKTKVQERKGSRWVMREPLVWFFPLDGFFNTMCLIRHTGIYYYVNLSSPPFFEDNTIKFIDYDLDIKLYPGEKTRVVDYPEFNRHVSKYGYPRRLVKKVHSTVKHVLDLIHYREDIFDRQIFDDFVNYLVSQRYLPQKYWR